MRLYGRALQDRVALCVRPERQAFADVQRAPLPHDRHVAFEHRLFGNHARQRDVIGCIEDWNRFVGLTGDVDVAVCRRRCSARQRVDVGSQRVAYLRKPFHDQELIAALQRVISQRRAEPG